DWGLETGDWGLETGDWRLETGDWRLETGDWRLISHASRSVPMFLRGSSVPINSTYPAAGANVRGVHGGAPGGQTAMLSERTPRRSTTSLAVNCDGTMTASARLACSPASAG